MADVANEVDKVDEVDEVDKVDEADEVDEVDEVQRVSIKFNEVGRGQPNHGAHVMCSPSKGSVCVMRYGGMAPLGSLRRSVLWCYRVMDQPGPLRYMYGVMTLHHGRS